MVLTLCTCAHTGRPANKEGFYVLTGSVCRADHPGTGHNLEGKSHSAHSPYCQSCPSGIAPHTSDLHSDIDLEDRVVKTHTHIMSKYLFIQLSIQPTKDISIIFLFKLYYL